MSRAMKPSGIEWIGEIPVGWELNPIKQLFNIGRGRVIAQTELLENGLYPVFSSQTLNNGCLGYINTFDFDVKQITWTTDGANAGTMFIRSGKHNCTNVCGTLLPKNKALSIEYSFFALSSISEHHKRLDTNGYKIMNNEMAVIIIPFPPLPEQQAIADYLDEKCELIDSTIERQKTAIEKLKLYKQSVITEAVTKGLDPSVPMKPSGIEWIGEVPEGWEVKKGKYVFDIYGSNISETFEKDFLELPYFKVDSLNMVKDNFYISEAPENLKVNHFVNSVKAPVILIPKRGAAIYTNKVRIITIDCLFDSNIMALRPINDDIKFLSYVIFGRKLTDIGDVSTIPQINNKHIRTLDIPLPPLPEQQAIAYYLDQKCAQIDQTIELKQKLIEKLSNYKKSLIYECVTGKREVGAS
jgi:type I restriction enzyme S subunit